MWGESALSKVCYNNKIEIVKLLLKHPKIKIDFNITNFKNNFKIYLYLKIKENQNLKKVLQILDTIED
jgi:hypothetical protein